MLSPAIQSAAQTCLSFKRQLSQKEIDKYREQLGISDPITPENTAKTEADSVYWTKSSSGVGLPSALIERGRGNYTYRKLAEKIANSPHPILGLEREIFITPALAEKQKEKLNSQSEGFPFLVAFHAPKSKKVLTFLTNNEQKAKELKDKATNPFTDDAECSSLSSHGSSHRSSSEEGRPAPAISNPFASPEDPKNPFAD